MIHRELANALLETRIGSGSPALLYIALLTRNPVFSDTGADLHEPTAASYQRLEVSNSSSNFSVATNGTVVNTQTFGFPTPPEDWGLVRGWALCDAATDGELLFSFKSSQQFIHEGKRPLIVSGGMSMRIRNV